MGQAAGRTRHRPLRALAAWRLTSWIARARLARLTRRQGRPPPASTSSDRSGRTRAAAAAGCGEPSCPSSEPWYANSTSWRPASHWSRHRAPAHRPGRQAGSPPRRPPASGDPARRPAATGRRSRTSTPQTRRSPLLAVAGPPDADSSHFCLLAELEWRTGAERSPPSQGGAHQSAGYRAQNKGSPGPAAHEHPSVNGRGARSRSGAWHPAST
jgi:hypothetical protein